MRRKMWSGVILVIVVALAVGQTIIRKAAASPKPATGVPRYELDDSWPKLEGNFGPKGTWTTGSVEGITVDPTNNHLWMVQSSHTLDNTETYAAQKPPVAECCIPAPPVLEFDAEGNFIQGWGGPGEGYEWPEVEHGISIDYKGNVWIGGYGKKDDQFLKFTKTGKFLLQIGHTGKSTGSLDTENLNEPTSAFVYPKTNEVFISDGYVNRRIIVFDADTGAFKRLWGAYGNKPDDSYPHIHRFPFVRPEDLPISSLFEGPAPQQFNLVHKVLISNDDLVYVADRSNNRIQVFRPDGTFVKEAFVERQLGTPTGSVKDIAFSTDNRQQFIFATSGDERVRILNRETLQVLGMFGRPGHFRGQFYHAHVLTSDLKGNIYIGEGKRAQKFEIKGYSTLPTQ